MTFESVCDAVADSAPVAEMADTALSDGPYLLHGEAGWVALTVHAPACVEARPCEPGEQLVIPSVEGRPAFAVTHRVGDPDPRDVLDVDRSRDLLVLGDTHGEFLIVTELLLAHHVIDAGLAWAFGKGHVIVLGDVFDRGPHQLALLWLFYKLDAEARLAGGGLHFLLGNHDVMVMRGDLRYMHARHKATAAALGYEGYADLFGAGSALGAWLRSRPAVVRLDEMLFVHGGIAPELAGKQWGPHNVNAGVARAIGLRQGVATQDAALMLAADPFSPLWYRGYFRRGKKRPALKAVDAALRAFGARRVFVGHTVVKRIGTLLDGRVVAVHVYPHLDKASGRPVLEALLRRGGKWRRINAQGESFAFNLRALK